MKLSNLLGRTALVGASLAMFAGTASAQIGAPVFKTGDIKVQFVFSSAQYTDDLYYFVTVGNFATAQFTFSNRAAAGTIVDVNDAALAIGAEAIFGICVTQGNPAPNANPNPTAGCSDVFYTGAASRNSDNQFHARVFTIAEYTAAFGALPAGVNLADGYNYIIGFEDIRNLGDRDYNDLIFAVRGVTPIPEPVTMTLLATGLAGMGGAGVFKRRKKA